ncbi:MAG: phosphatase PAP2 family protein [Promethearchaeota archaeon]
MSEKENFLSKRALLIIGATALAILIVGIILYYTGFNEEFYSSNSTIRTIFGIITYLGDPTVFIIIILVLFLAYNKSFAKNLGLSLLFSYYLGGLIKEIFKDPRPTTNEDSTEDYGLIETSYGFPSTHSQNAVTFWGYISYEFKDKYKYKAISIVPLILSALIFLVAISRLIIGVHDLQDVIGGLLFGIGFILAFIYLEPIFSKQFNKLSFVIKIILVVGVCMGLFLFGTLMFPSAGLNLVDPPLLYRDEGAFAQTSGALLGLGIGYLLEQEFVQYNPSELNNKIKIINIVIGIIIIFAVFLPLDYLLKIDSVIYRFVRYAIVGFIAIYLVPLICTKIDLKL